MKDADLIRQLVRLRSRDAVPDEVLRRMGAAQLHARPEALVLAIVRGYYEFKSNGYSDADIYREIEGRRAAAYGEEPLPADLNLESYTSYRMRLEHPGEAALHDPVFAIQAVHRVREFLEDQFGPEGTPPSLRTLPLGHFAVLVYGAIVGVVQGVGSVVHLASGKYSGASSVELSLYLALAVAIVAGSVGYAGRAIWGRPFLLGAIAAQIAVPWGIIATYGPDQVAAPFSFALFHAGHSLIVLALLAYVYRHGGEPRAAIRA
jgi:hypothetical protein